MKTISIIVIVIALVFTFVSCDAAQVNEPEVTSATVEVTETEPETETETETSLPEKWQCILLYDGEIDRLEILELEEKPENFYEFEGGETIFYEESLDENYGPSWVRVNVVEDDTDWIEFDLHTAEAYLMIYLDYTDEKGMKVHSQMFVDLSTHEYEYVY